MEYLVFSVGFLFVLAGVVIKFLHKVKPNHVTVIELWGGKKIITLKEGLYILINLPPFIEIKKSNLYLGVVTLGPLAGLEEEGWDDDWQNRPPHPNPEELDFNIVPGVEFSDGSTALIELVLPLKIKTTSSTDHIKKFLYGFERPVSTVVDIAKAVTRAAAAKYSFNEAIKDKADELRKEILTNILNLMKEQDLDTGLKFVIPKNQEMFRVIKNFYPCPETKKARSDLYEAKQKGKAEVEIATGKALADEKRGEGWGKKIKQKADVSGVGIDNAFAHENLETAGEVLGDKTVILGSGGKGINEMVAGLVATGTAVAKNQQSANTGNQEGENK